MLLGPTEDMVGQQGNDGGVAVPLGESDCVRSTLGTPNPPLGIDMYLSRLLTAPPP